MSPEWQIDDDTVEAIVGGDLVDGHWTPLVTFARQVQEIEHAPAPLPSAELASLLDGTESPQLGSSAGHDKPVEPVLVAASVDVPPTATERARHSNRRRRMPLVETLVAKVAGLGMVAKVGVCASAVAATGATAAGVQTVTSGSGDGAQVAADASAGDRTADAEADVGVDEGASADVNELAEADASEDGADVSTGAADVGVSDDGQVQIDLDVPVDQLLQQHSLEEVLADVPLEDLLQRYTLEELLAEVSLEDLLQVVPADELQQVVSVEDLLAAGVPPSELQQQLPDAELPELPTAPGTPDLPEAPDPSLPPLPAPVRGPEADGSARNDVDASLTG